MAMEPMALPCPQSLDLLAGSNTTQLELVLLTLAQKHVLDAALTTSLTTILVLYANFNFTYLVLAVTKVFQAMALPFLLLGMLVAPMLQPETRTTGEGDLEALISVHRPCART